MLLNVSHYNLIYPIIILLFSIGLIYFIIKRLNLKIRRWITISHILITSWGIILILFPNLFTQLLFNRVNSTIEIGLLITILIQLFFILNFFKTYKKLDI